MIRIALTTFPDETAAARSVRTLVSEGLAACGTLVPGARSIYRWQGQIEDSSETLVIFKLAAERQEAFRERLLSLHPYDIPELAFLAPEGVHPPYADWVCGLPQA